MGIFGTNMIFALVWVAITGNSSLNGLLIGFAVGFGALWLVQPLTGASSYFFRVFAWVRLVVLFIYELFLSSFVVVWDILTPQHMSRPAIIEVPLNVKSDAGLLLVTNLISLTPGTLSLDISDDRKTLFVHAMFGDNPDELRESIKNGMEKWVIDAVEGEP
ncbi:MAG: Na+/H+ antiporter subunit E [Pseudomonadota bacterium]